MKYGYFKSPKHLVITNNIPDCDEYYVNARYKIEDRLLYFYGTRIKTDKLSETIWQDFFNEGLYIQEDTLVCIGSNEQIKVTYNIDYYLKKYGDIIKQCPIIVKRGWFGLSQNLVTEKNKLSGQLWKIRKDVLKLPEIERIAYYIPIGHYQQIKQTKIHKILSKFTVTEEK